MAYADLQHDDLARIRGKVPQPFHEEENGDDDAFFPRVYRPCIVTGTRPVAPE